MSFTESHTLEQHAQSQADYLPQGKFWRAKNINDSNLRKLLRGLGASTKRQEDIYNQFWEELFIGTSNEFLDDFEKAVGIPDDCFDGQGTIEERRLNVQIKLVSLYVSTEQDFIDLANLLGFIIAIIRPVEDAFPPYDVPFIPLGLKESRFTWIIQGENLISNLPPYDVPFIPDGTDNGNILVCLFNKLKPANTRLIYQNL